VELAARVSALRALSVQPVVRSLLLAYFPPTPAVLAAYSQQARPVLAIVATALSPALCTVTGGQAAVQRTDQQRVLALSKQMAEMVRPVAAAEVLVVR